MESTVMSEFTAQQDTHAVNGPRRAFLKGAGSTLAAPLLAPYIGASAAARADDTGSEDVRHYGVVANTKAAATANAAALKKLVNPGSSFSGRLVFPNGGGTDVYYFDDLIAFREGIHVDLQGSTLNFQKAGVKQDSASGFIHALRDFSLENGTLITDYTFSAGYNTGNALALGGRGSDSALFPPIYDSLLPAPMGNIVLRNLHIVTRSSDKGGRGMFMLGGLDGVLIDNVVIDGQGQTAAGIYYEFGWATNEVQQRERQTAHARNFRVTNLTVSNVVNEAFGSEGAYDIVIDGMTARNVGYACLVGTGEALYFRPWSRLAQAGRRASFVVRNLNGEGIVNLGIMVTGASKIAGSYLDNPPAHDNPNGLSVDQQTDLIDFVAENFSLTGSQKNHGISTSAASAQLTHGTLVGFQRGIVTTQECTRFVIDSVKVLDSASFGIQIGQAVSLHSPPRQASGTISNCVVAGSGTQSKCAGIFVATTRSCLIENCRFGYSASSDGKPERTQTQAVSVNADAAGVVCRNDEVVATADGAVAYALAGGGGRGCRIENPRGIHTASGPWS
jgi:hypothetical protein